MKFCVTLLEFIKSFSLLLYLVEVDTLPPVFTVVKCKLIHDQLVSIDIRLKPFNVFFQRFMKIIDLFFMITYSLESKISGVYDKWFG